MWLRYPVCLVLSFPVLHPVHSSEGHAQGPGPGGGPGSQPSAPGSGAQEEQGVTGPRGTPLGAGLWSYLSLERDGRWFNASPARGGCPWPRLLPRPPRPAPRPAPRGRGSRADRRGRRADRPAGPGAAPRVWGPLRREERRVHAPSQLDSRDPRSPGNRGGGASPRPPGSTRPQLRGRTRAPRGRAAAPGRVLESSPRTAVRGAAGKGGRLSASRCREPGAAAGAPRLRGGRLSCALLLVPSRSLPAWDPLRATQPWRRALDGAAEWTRS